MPSKLIGVDVGGTTVKFAIFNVHGDIQDQWSFQTDPLDNGNRVVPDIIHSIQHRVGLYDMKLSDFYGVGLDFPGTVTDHGRAVVGAYHLNWDTPHAVKQPLEEALGIPVILQNDANAAALGENWKGAGNNSTNMLMVTLGTGIGSGIIAGGRLLTGFLGSAGEIGHICVVPNGFKCSCGNEGCLEEYASATGIVRVAHAQAEEYEGTSRLKAMLDQGEEVSSKTVVDLARDNDYLAEQALNQSCTYLGTALSYVGNTLNPETMIIGGGVSAAGQFLLNLIEKPLREHLFPTMKKNTQLKLAESGNTAGLIGAASLVLSTIDDTELTATERIAKQMVL